MKAYLGHTLPTAYYRMIQFAQEMDKQKLLDVRMNQYDPTGNYLSMPSFEVLIENPKTRVKISEELDKLNTEEKVDIYVFQKFCSCWGLALIDLVTKNYHKPVIMEIDDYMFGLAGDHPNVEMFGPETELSRVGRAQLQLSQAVIVSTDYLKELYKDENFHIFVVPNAVDFTKWDHLVNKTKKTYINIGWEGGSGHDRDLKILIPVIREILPKYKNIRFTLTGDPHILENEFGNHKQVKIIKNWVTPAEYPEYKAKQGFDIELAPLVDSNFNRAKSNLRWLEASALKIPMVSSNIGPYKNTNAIKCSTTEEWVSALESLIKDPLKRKSVGQEGYDLVKKNFNIIDVSSKYASILNEVHEGWQKGLKK